MFAFNSTSKFEYGRHNGALIMFCIVLAIPTAIIILFLVIKNGNNRLKRVEEKLDKVLEESENNTG
ncbi:hypothetical protein SAMN05216362_11440 [Piscibacillus halophilus]|uniref:CcmD family protein n=1 Tax=Piscibacillus halophilus TaxID=571933 RepID=A0A1H9G6Q5_9BACI|nr:hypothetical protein [Piscibacillus halophilus]SEQ45752.1 hypothetical protein SAMN05216362_11440 [Piscibacillus halophilus]